MCVSVCAGLWWDRYNGTMNVITLTFMCMCVFVCYCLGWAIKIDHYLQWQTNIYVIMYSLWLKHCTAHCSAYIELSTVRPSGNRSPNPGCFHVHVMFILNVVLYQWRHTTRTEINTYTQRTHSLTHMRTNLDIYIHVCMHTHTPTPINAPLFTAQYLSGVAYHISSWIE